MPFLTRRSAQTVAVLAVTQLIGWGTTFEVLGVMGRVIAPQLGLPNEVIFGGLTIMMIVSALAGPQTGRLLARHGAARVLAAGATAFATGLGLLAVADGIGIYILAWIVIGIGGALGLSAPAYTAVVEREGPDAKRVIAILMLFTGLSVTIFWPLLSLLNDLMGWRLTFALCAGCQLFICVPLYLAALPKPISADSAAEVADSVPVPLSANQRRAAFALVAVTTTIASFVTFGIAPTLLELLQRAGATPEFALQLAAARGVIGISARSIDMLLGRRGNPFLTSVAGCSFLLLGLGCLLFLPPSSVALGAFILFYGFGSGVLVVARALLPLALFSPREFGLQSARLSLPQNLANAAAPVIFTALIDRFDHQTAIVFAGGLVCLALLAIAQLICLVRRAHRDAAIPSPPGTAAPP